MEHPEYLYYAAMFLIALPVAWFGKNEVAGIVFGTWAVGQTTFLLGFPEPETQIVIYLVALALALKVARSSVCFFAAILFFPLALACVSELAGWMTPLQAWWSIYWVAMTQALALPACLDWPAVYRSARARFGRTGGSGMLRAQHT